MLYQKYRNILPLKVFSSGDIQYFIDYCIREGYVDERLFMLIEEKLIRNEC